MKKFIIHIRNRKFIEQWLKNWFLYYNAGKSIENGIYQGFYNFPIWVDHTTKHISYECGDISNFIIKFYERSIERKGNISNDHVVRAITLNNIDVQSGLDINIF